MASIGKTDLIIDFSPFLKSVDVAISRVQRGTKKATKAACEEILGESLRQVPRDTDTLANSGAYEILGSYTNFVGIINYGGIKDPVNPKTHKHASEYMVAVHEDLSAHHMIGKAKFLEDPVNDYKNKFTSKAGEIIRTELGDSL